MDSREQTRHREMLREAVRNGSVEVISRLLDTSSRESWEDQDGGDFRNLLMADAIDLGRCDAVKALIQGGCDVSEHHHGILHLHRAVARGRSDIVKVLLQRGADVTVQNEVTGKTALHMAAATIVDSSCTDIIETVILSESCERRNGSKGKHRNIARDFPKCKPDICVDSSTYKCLATEHSVKDGNTTFNNNSNNNNNNNNNNNTEDNLVSTTHMNILHDRKESYNNRSFSNELLQCSDFLERRDKVQGNTALHVACAYNNSHAALCLLRHGADPNPINDHGDTPLAKLLQPVTRKMEDFHNRSRLALARRLVALGLVVSDRNERASPHSWYENSETDTGGHCGTGRGELNNEESVCSVKGKVNFRNGCYAEKENVELGKRYSYAGSLEVDNKNPYYLKTKDMSDEIVRNGKVRSLENTCGSKSGKAKVGNNILSDFKTHKGTTGRGNGSDMKSSVEMKSSGSTTSNKFMSGLTSGCGVSSTVGAPGRTSGGSKGSLTRDSCTYSSSLLQPKPLSQEELAEAQLEALCEFPSSNETTTVESKLDLHPNKSSGIALNREQSKLKSSFKTQKGADSRFDPHLFPERRRSRSRSEVKISSQVKVGSGLVKESSAFDSVTLTNPSSSKDLQAQLCGCIAQNDRSMTPSSPKPSDAKLSSGSQQEAVKENSSTKSVSRHRRSPNNAAAPDKQNFAQRAVGASCSSDQCNHGTGTSSGFKQPSPTKQLGALSHEPAAQEQFTTREKLRPKPLLQGDIDLLGAQTRSAACSAAKERSAIENFDTCLSPIEESDTLSPTAHQRSPQLNKDGQEDTASTFFKSSYDSKSTSSTNTLLSVSNHKSNSQEKEMLHLSAQKHVDKVVHSNNNLQIKQKAKIPPTFENGYAQPHETTLKVAGTFQDERPSLKTVMTVRKTRDQSKEISETSSQVRNERSPDPAGERQKNRTATMTRFRYPSREERIRLRFKRLLGELSVTLSLQQLCRLAILKSLVGQNVSKSVDKLGLPQLMQKFLLCDDLY